jgi:hypothetical protein
LPPLLVGGAVLQQVSPRGGFPLAPRPGSRQLTHIDGSLAVSGYPPQARHRLGAQVADDVVEVALIAEGIARVTGVVALLVGADGARLVVVPAVDEPALSTAVLAFAQPSRLLAAGALSAVSLDSALDC